MVVFKTIPDVDCRYLAGNDGNIYSKFGAKGSLKKLKGGLNGKGTYLHVSILTTTGVRVSKDVHKLICTAFHGKSKLTVAHCDGDSFNNKPCNLEWKTLKDNHKDKHLHGTDDKGCNNSRAKLNKVQLIEVRKLLKEKQLTHKQIGDKVGVSRVFITKINCGMRY